MAFDFPAYLTRIDPSQSYNVAKLQGGVVNFTVRASKEGPQGAPGGRFPEDESLILKQAPPYVAGVGESAPFSQFRQTIEARALSLFLPQAHLLDPICTQSSVSVPKVLMHDNEEHVLILSDLGQLPDLSDVFSALGGYIPMASAAPAAVSDLALQRPLSFYVTVGQKIGSFFARLHSSTTLARVVGSPDRGEKFLYSPKTKEVVYEFAVKPIKALLDSLPDILDVTRSRILYQRIEDDFLRQTMGEELALVLGDCWTGAILVDVSENNPTIGVIDWEFAGIGRASNGDMSQLMAHLHLFQIAAEWRREEILLQRITALMESLANAYREQSMEEGAKWIPEPATPLSTLQATVVRSAFLAHGSEMINSSFWKVWLCEDKTCGEPHPAEKRDCRLIQHMVQTAVWYLDRAGQDEGEFVGGTNWEKVRDESIMFPLFHSH